MEGKKPGEKREGASLQGSPGDSSLLLAKAGFLTYPMARVFQAQPYLQAEEEAPDNGQFAGIARDSPTSKHALCFVTMPEGPALRVTP